ncbi:MAG TPA: phosphoribosylanthranilate isomerase [Chloroflexota bacterium]|nr:phosphoribosylanthranilate isomerase [Chloroflexota bacterium]
MIVKICGIRSLDAARAAAASGADLLGFNFAPVSKRRIDVKTAKEAIAACRALNRPPQMTGIFVNQPLHEVTEISREVGLDYVQLSGDEDAAYCLAVTARAQRLLIKAVRLGDPRGMPDVDELGGLADALLADASVAGSYGGSGQAWDWSDAAGLAARYPVLLAGGLRPDNVAEAISTVRPWGVDVASGVETSGRTDPERVRAFIQQVREHEHSDTDN